MDLKAFIAIVKATSFSVASKEFEIVTDLKIRQDYIEEVDS